MNGILQKLPLLALGTCTLASAAAPLLHRLEPPGGQRGSALTVILRGEQLRPDARIQSRIPGAITALTPEKPGGELPLLIEIAEDAPVGLYPVRVETKEGLSNILLFSVGAFPETVEAESELRIDRHANDARTDAQRVETPVVVNGTLRGADRDFYWISAQRGEQLVFEVEARRAGSALDPVIEVSDGAGMALGRNNDAPGLGVDARVEVTFPAAGDYFVQVHDARFSEQEQNFYRLKIGRFAYAEGIFPLGWQRGGELDVELFGGNLPAAMRVRLDLGELDAAAETTMIAVPGEPGSQPIPFLVRDDPELIEPRREGDGAVALTPSTVMNGRISEPDEIDRYTLAVSAGESWFIELQAASLGTSDLYGVIHLYDSEGERLAAAGYEAGEPHPNVVRATLDTNTNPTIALDVPEGIHELNIEVEDLLGRGGPGYAYRLAARKQPPDFLLTLDTPYVNIPERGTATVTVTAERRGYWGPIQLGIPDAPDDLMVEGGYILEEQDTRRGRRTFQTAILTITPKPGVQSRSLELSVWGEGITGTGEVIRRRARGSGMRTAIAGKGQKPSDGRWLNLELPAKLTPPQPAVLEVLTPRYVRLVPGMVHELKWSFAARRSGIRPPSKVATGGNTGGLVTMREKKQEDGPRGSGILEVKTTERTTVTKLDVYLTTTIEIDGRDERINSPAVRFDMVQGYTIEPPAELTAIKPGASVELAGQLRREPEFQSPITLRAENLPLGVECDTIQLSAQTDAFRLPCRAHRSAEPGEYEFELVSSSTLSGREKQKVPYRIPPVKAKLLVSGKRAKTQRAAR